MPVVEFKVVIIGSVAVGKTSITNRLQYSQFEEEYQPTVGAGYVSYRTTSEGQDVELQIWDTAGMERYHSLGPIYYRDAVAAIIVYDQGDRQSADALSKWLGAFRQTVKGQAYIAIAANKDDREEKTVDPEPIRQWATENHFEFFITSAKTGKGIDELFQSLVKHLLVNTSADPADPKAAPPLIQDGGPAGARAVCC